MKIPRKFFCIFFAFAVIFLGGAFSLAESAEVLFRYKGEIGQVRRYLLTLPGMSKGGYQSGVTTYTRVEELVEKVVEVGEDHYSSVVTAVVRQGSGEEGDENGRIKTTSMKHKFRSLGYNVSDSRRTGTSDHPKGYMGFNSWDAFLIFSEDPVEVGGQWTVDFYTGNDMGWFGVNSVFPVHIVSTFVGMEMQNGRNCAKITFTLQGGRQESFEDKERYDRSTSGSGVMYFDPQDGVICYYHKEVSFHNKEESYGQMFIDGEWKWIWKKDTDRTTTSEFTLELVEVIPPGS